MGGQKEWSAIDVLAVLIYTIQKRWEAKKLTATLFIDVKSVFDHVLKA